MELHKLDTETSVFFYEQEFYVLSNFSAFNLRYKGFLFATSEHAYQWSKFRPPNDGGIAFLIRIASSAHDAFKLAEEHYKFRRPDWNEIKDNIMLDILRHKAKQHEYVRRKLLETGDRVLIEDSWRDDYWGWGSNKDGKNRLGKLWMQVREEIRNADALIKRGDK